MTEVTGPLEASGSQTSKEFMGLVSGGGVPVDCSDLTYSYGGEEVAIDGINLSVDRGEFVTLLGPSGSGKTTLLKLLGGLAIPTQGRIRFGTIDVTDLPPRDRKAGFVFQNYALFPHMTVFENVAFGLRLKSRTEAEITSRVFTLLQLLYMQDKSASRPQHLSGGQQQRVALARALAIEPRVLLMDEPLGALDRRLRERLQIELRELQRQLAITTIYVTHDQDEAFSMSDRIAVMRAGQIEQVGMPEELYRAPDSLFVASLCGVVNLIPSHWSKQGMRGDFGLRPESIQLTPLTPANDPIGIVRSVVCHGGRYRLRIDCEGRESPIVVETVDNPGWRESDEVAIVWQPDREMQFRPGGRP